MLNRAMPKPFAVLAVRGETRVIKSEVDNYCCGDGSNIIDEGESPEAPMSASVL